MRLKLNILLITLLALSSCAKESGGRGSDDQGTGTLHVRFDVPANAGVTKVDGVSGGGYAGTHNVLDKDNIIKSGRLLLVDKTGIVVAYRKADNKNGIIGNSSGTEVIKDIKRGDYKLYVVVNGSDKQHETLDGKYDIQVGSKLNIDAFLQSELSDGRLNNGESPTFASERGVPCSYVTDVAITAGNNYVDAHLERCVGRLTIKVLNNIPDRKLAIRSIGLSADNPVTGYYIQPSGNGSVSKVAFPELTGVVEFAPNENKTIFDHYVYETDVVDEGLSFDLFGAVYGSKETVSFDENKVDVYKFGQNITSGWSPQNNEIYLLRSAASPDYYIGDLDGKLGCSANSDDVEFGHRNDVKNYLWEVSVSGSETKYKFKNFGTNRYISLDRTTLSLVNDSNGTAFSIKPSSNGYCFYENQWTSGYSFWAVYDDYYIAYNSNPDNSLIGSTTQDANAEWILRKADLIQEGVFNNSDAIIPRNRRQIKIVDKYGDAQLLQQIKRNEHVTVSINIFYNRELGQFDFMVSSWKEISNETTFD